MDFGRTVSSFVQHSAAAAATATTPSTARDASAHDAHDASAQSAQSETGEGIEDIGSFVSSMPTTWFVGSLILIVLACTTCLAWCLCRDLMSPRADGRSKRRSKNDRAARREREEGREGGRSKKKRKKKRRGGGSEVGSTTSTVLSSEEEALLSNDRDRISDHDLRVTFRCVSGRAGLEHGAPRGPGRVVLRLARSLARSQPPRPFHRPTIALEIC